jgi:uncharacterized membrane protein
MTPLHPSRANELPIAPPFAAVLLLGLILVIAMIEVGVLEYTYERIGIGHRFFGGLLLASLLGSVINIPLTQSRGDGEKRTIVAVNLGGAVIPVLLSLHLLWQHGLYVRGAVAVAAVAAVSYSLARPVAGVGIAVPIFVSPAVAAIVAYLLQPESPAPLAYAAGSVGTLIGADLMNLGRIRSLGGSVLSIGGAGTFDGIFLTGVLAVLLA